MTRDTQAPLSIPPQLQHLLTYLAKPKFKGRYSSTAYVYELHTGYSCVDGYYPSRGDAMSAILSEGMLLTILKENINA